LRWKLGRFEKLNVPHGRGFRHKGAKPRRVSLINGADRSSLSWNTESIGDLCDIRSMR
jgi:hypothetical protein